MPTDPNSLAERVANSIQQLSVVATDLNSASDELGRAIAAIDTVLQSLSLGVPTWTLIERFEDSDGEYFRYSKIGYAKVGHKWGIALQKGSGEYRDPEEEKCESWIFQDAPRALRVKGVEKIPDLIEALIKATKEMTEEIQSKTVKANALATVIAQAAKKRPKETDKAAVFAAARAVSLEAMQKTLAGGKK